MSDSANTPARFRRTLMQRTVWFVLRNLSYIWLIVCYRFRSTGKRNTPPAGGALVVANHQSFLDPMIVGAALKRRAFSSLGRATLFDHWFFGWLIRQLTCIPLDQSKGDTAAMKEGLRRIHGGDLLLIYPEGARSRDGEMAPFQKGVALLLKRGRCPVVPVAFDGAQNAWPRGSGRPRLFGRIRAAVGEPIEYDELMKDGLEAGLKRVEAEVRSLLAGLRGGEPPATNPAATDSP